MVEVLRALPSAERLEYGGNSLGIALQFFLTQGALQRLEGDADEHGIMPGGQGLAGPGIQAITALTVSGSTRTGVGFTASPAGEQPVFWQSPVR